mmetsp:Transcript_2190/g.3068  ORF Transcript_2190/g.3068 Transcript_2190/m.3068 type:complete len:407 (+) Transcript_2190:810-2030(+)
MESAKKAGIANPSCQLYMFFYYIGPASAIIPFLFCNRSGTRTNSNGSTTTERRIHHTAKHGNVSSSSSEPPALTSLQRLFTWQIWKKAGSVAIVDIVAQTLNYTGSTMAGPTIFAIIYSSVTIWCAVFSRCILGRSMSLGQWGGVVLVFSGLAITGLQSVDLGPQVFHGSTLIILGSALHALMYVFSEHVMNGHTNRHGSSSSSSRTEPVSALQYCAIYGSTACLGYGLWQIVYTIPNLDTLIWQPMQEANTSVSGAMYILCTITITSFIHSVTFFHTVKYFPGGATSAGVMKALQAVLVFVATAWVFCGKIGGSEMCFTIDKLLSLIIVVIGVLIFGKATEAMKKKQLVEDEYTSQDMTTNNNRNNTTQPHEGYQTFGNIDNTIADEEEGPLILGSIEFKPKLQS